MKLALVGLDWDVIDLIESLGNHEIMGVFAPQDPELEAFSYLGSDDAWEAVQKDLPDLKVVLSVDVPSLRKALFSSYGKAVVSLVSEKAYISKRAQLSSGCMIQRGVSLMPNVQLGFGCKVNVNATLHHDTQIGDFCTIAPGALILGNVKIAQGVYVGAGAIIKQNCQIGENAVLGAGSVVVKDVPSGKTVVGVPAKEFSRESPRDFSFLGK